MWVLQFLVVQMLQAMRMMTSMKKGTYSFSLSNLKMPSRGLEVLTATVWDSGSYCILEHNELVFGKGEEFKVCQGKGLAIPWV